MCHRGDVVHGVVHDVCLRVVGLHPL
jgi:hypothetical protein